MEVKGEIYSKLLTRSESEESGRILCQLVTRIVESWQWWTIRLLQDSDNCFIRRLPVIAAQLNMTGCRIHHYCQAIRLCPIPLLYLHL